MSFRDRLVATLRAIEPVLLEPGVLVVGSEVPNLLEPGAAATLVVSQDVDIGVPVAAHSAVKGRLRSVRDLRPSPEEPSVWIPDQGSPLLEVNFLGMDAALSIPQLRTSSKITSFRCLSSERSPSSSPPIPSTSTGSGSRFRAKLVSFWRRRERVATLLRRLEEREVL